MIELSVLLFARLGSVGAPFFEKTARFAFGTQKISKAVVSIVVVNDKEIEQLNHKWLGHAYPTDVITFPLGHDPLEAEIIISAETARRQSKEYRVSLRHELARLLIHGILHLTGYDDGTEAERTRMRQRENELLSRSPGLKKTGMQS